MNREKIFKYSLAYRMLKFYIGFGFRRYYRKTYIIGKENILYNEPVIFAPPHQNALTDPLLVLFNIREQPVFMARADIFNKPFLNKLLTFFKILPVYRIRDGISNLQNNDEIFNYAVKVLEAKKHLVILPEASHDAHRTLRPLKKGICRIALQAEQNNNFKLGVKIVPVGIEYEHYIKFYKSVYLHFGKPIEIQDYYELYKQNDIQALNKLRNDLEESMKELIIHIGNKEYYKLYDKLRDIFKYRMKNIMGFEDVELPNKVVFDRKLIECLDNEFLVNKDSIHKLHEKVTFYLNILDNLKIRDWIVRREKFSWFGLFFHFIWLVFLLPLFLYGFINNYLPYRFPVLIANNFKDSAYHSSVRSVGATLLFTIFYMLQLIIAQLVTKDWLFSLGYLVSLPITGYMALLYTFSFKKFMGKFVWLRYKNKKQLISLRNEIINITDEIVRRQLKNN